MKYLVTFIYKDKYADFCLVEFLSICSMLKINLIKYNKNWSYDTEKEPYISIYFDDIDNKDICEKIINRAVLTKSIIKIYSEGNTIDEVVANLKIEDIQNELNSEESYKFDIDLRKMNLKQEDRLNLMEKFDKFHFKSKAELNSPSRIFVIFKNYIVNENRYYCFFGKQIAGKNNKQTRFYTKYDLTNRKYLGPTSTDNMLSFIMCNLAQIKHNDFIIDPFVGTGSLLIPPSHFGAFCYGCDLDIRVLQGYSIGYVKKDNVYLHEEGNIFTNFEEYNLEKPQIIRQDINSHCFKKMNLYFDAMICDPPYGFRASSMKSGISSSKKRKRIKRLDKHKEQEQFNPDIIDYGEGKRLFLPLKVCDVNQIYNKLMEFANECLKDNGILVFLYPMRKEEECEYLPVNFPKHKSFQLLYACHNTLSNSNERWCLVFQKRKN